MLFCRDWSVLWLQLRSDYEATAKRFGDFVVIAQRLQSDCVAIAQRLQSDRKAIVD
jgi:hypothetical protein